MLSASGFAEFEEINIACVNQMSSSSLPSADQQFAICSEET